MSNSPKGIAVPRQRPRDAFGPDAGHQVREVQVVGRLVPIMPAVVAGEEHYVLACRAPGDARGDGAGVSAPLAVLDHLGAGDGVDQLLGQLDLFRAVDGVDAATVDLLLDRVVHHIVVVPQDDRADGVDPVDVLVAVDIHEPGPLGPVGVDGTYALGEAAREPAAQLSIAGNQLTGTRVYLGGLLYALVVVIAHLLPPCRSIEP